MAGGRIKRVFTGWLILTLPAGATARQSDLRGFVGGCGNCDLHA